MSENREMPVKTEETADRAQVNVVLERGVATLSAGDSAFFAEALLDPPAPNQYLKRAAARHKQLITGS